jgi:hypothetical protein
MLRGIHVSAVSLQHASQSRMKPAEKEAAIGVSVFSYTEFVYAKITKIPLLKNY